VNAVRFRSWLGTAALVAAAAATAALALRFGGPGVRSFDGSVSVHRAANVTLTDDRGRPIVVGTSPTGTIVVLGYTRCQDECPLTLARVALALAQLPRAVAPSALFVTVDPAHDDPATLHAYLRTWQNRIVGVTGKPSALRRLETSLGADDPGSRYRDHDTRIFVLNAAGEVREELSPSAGPDEIRRALG
jgi:protein SCO1